MKSPHPTHKATSHYAQPVTNLSPGSHSTADGTATTTKNTFSIHFQTLLPFSYWHFAINFERFVAF
jgi:hypothetical protein